MPVATRSKTKDGEAELETNTNVSGEKEKSIIEKGDLSDENSILTTIVSSEWKKYRDLEADKLRTIDPLIDLDPANVDAWIENATRIYDEIFYPDINRIYQILTYLDEREKKWYAIERDEIGCDWQRFCVSLRQHALILSNGMVKNQNDETVSSETSSKNLDAFVDQNFQKFLGHGDAEQWLSDVVKRFTQLKLGRHEQFKLLPMLLEDKAYLWYVKNLQLMNNMETFYNLFLLRFASKQDPKNEKNSSLATNLLNTMASEIIKTPSFYDGVKEDVDDWLEKLEARFNMADWDDEQKLRYISIHLQGDAYKWWIKVAAKIKTWAIFTVEVRQTFGSTKAKEKAFEQLRSYKQTVNQSVIQYYEKIIELCKKVDSNMSDTMTLQYLTAGMKDSMKLHMGLHDPQTTDAFLKFARKIEDTLSLTNLNYLSHQEETQAGSSNFPITLSAINYKKKIGDDISSNGKKEHQNKQIFQKFSIETDEQKVAGKNSYSSNGKKTKLCYYCGTPGHLYRDCARSHFDQRKHQ